jgi:hypothetical protein
MNSHPLFVRQLALRCALSPTRGTSLLSLVSLQQEIVSSEGKDAYLAKMSRVLEKLSKRVIQEEHETNPKNGLKQINLEALLSAMHFCLQRIKGARLSRPADVLKPASSTVKDLMLEIIKCRDESSIRDALYRLGLLDSGSPIALLRVQCEQELGRVSTVADVSHSESRSTLLASLIKRVGEGDEAGTAELSHFQKSRPDMFNAYVSELSATFKGHIMGRLKEHNSSETMTGETVSSRATLGDRSVPIADRINSLKISLKKAEEQVQSANSARLSSDVVVPTSGSIQPSSSNLRARLEALKQQPSSGSGI